MQSEKSCEAEEQLYVNQYVLAMNLRRWISQNEKHRIQRFDPCESLVAYRLVCLFVCLCSGYLKNLWTDPDEILWTGWLCDKDELFRFW